MKIPSSSKYFESSVAGYLFGSLVVFTTVVIRVLAEPYLGNENPFLGLIFPIIITSLFYGFRAGIFTTILSALLGIYFFLDPQYTMSIGNKSNYVRLISFMIEGFFISILGYFLRIRKKKLEQTLKSLSLSSERQNIADQKARQLEEDLAKVWRLNTLGEMASGLAHELSQPISAIRNYAVAIEKLLGSTTDPKVQTSVKGIISEAERATQFIYSLRSFIGSRNPDRKLEAINEVISDVTLLIKSELNANKVSMKLSLSEPSLKVPLDKIQLIQVILNLFRNSIESMNNSSDRKEIFVGTTTQGDGLLLCVSDTGCGIPVTETNRVYDAFFSTKKSGMGMGLAISRSIIEIHEGKIWNVPNEPKGTTFMIWLPNKVVY